MGKKVKHKRAKRPSAAPMEPHQTETSLNSPKKMLERTTLEFYAGIILGVILAVVPMNVATRCILLFGVLGLLIDVCWRASWMIDRKRSIKIIATLFLVVAYVVGVIALIGYERQTTVTSETKQSPAPIITPSHTPKTLHDYFMTDLAPPFSKIYGKHILNFSDKSSFQLEFNLYFDIATKTEFVGFYISNSPLTYRICEFLALTHKDILALLEKRLKVELGSQGERPMESKGIRFTGRIFLYHEFPLSVSDTDALRQFYKKKGLDPQFRGPNYVLSQNNAIGYPPSVPMFQQPSPSEQSTPLHHL